MSKLLSRFIHPTTAQKLKVLAWVVACANVPLTIGATITGVPDWLKWLTPYWPGIFAVAGIIHQTASTFGISVDATLSALITHGFVTVEQVAAALAKSKTPTTPPPTA